MLDLNDDDQPVLADQTRDDTRPRAGEARRYECEGCPYACRNKGEDGPNASETRSGGAEAADAFDAKPDSEIRSRKNSLRRNDRKDPTDEVGSLLIRR